ncbi:MAG: hypothetical protein QXT69_05365 [Fervidicoccaceae archaeon]
MRDMLLRRKVVLAVVDPRKFYLLAEGMRSLGINFSIPEALPFVCSEEELVLLDEDREDMATGDCEKVLVKSTEKNFIMSLLPRVSGKRAFDELAVGVDLGLNSAYVVYGDGLLLLKGKVAIEKLSRTLKEISMIPHERMIVWIGSWTGGEEMWNVVGEILELGGISIEIVDEYGTSRNSLEREKDPDLRAAKLILKRGRGK